MELHCWHWEHGSSSCGKQLYQVGTNVTFAIGYVWTGITAHIQYKNELHGLILNAAYNTTIFEVAIDIWAAIT